MLFVMFQMVLSLKRELATVSDTCRELDRRAVEAVATAAEARAREDALLSLQDDTVRSVCPCRVQHTVCM